MVVNQSNVELSLDVCPHGAVLITSAGEDYNTRLPEMKASEELNHFKCCILLRYLAITNLEERHVINPGLLDETSWQAYFTLLSLPRTLTHPLESIKT